MLSQFVDTYGNTGSFWTLTYQGKSYTLLKLKSPEKEGDANFAFDAASLVEFEQKVAELRKAPNNLKSDGFQVLWSKSFGDATVSTLVARFKGLKVKLIKIAQKPEGKPATEHDISIDREAYSAFQSALHKARKKP